MARGGPPCLLRELPCVGFHRSSAEVGLDGDVLKDRIDAERAEGVVPELGGVLDQLEAGIVFITQDDYASLTRHLRSGRRGKEQNTKKQSSKNRGNGRPKNTKPWRPCICRSCGWSLGG